MTNREKAVEYWQHRQGKQPDGSYVAVITWDDIDVGLVADCSRCPGARAIKRALGSLAVWVGVGPIDMSIHLADGKWVDIFNSPAFKRFVKAFDSNQSVTPLAIRIHLPQS